MQRRHRTQAFTLIEVLVVIGIIAVLVTLVTMGVRSVTASAKTKATEVAMENLKNFITEKKVTGGGQQLDQVYPFVTTGTAPNVRTIYLEAAPMRFPKSYETKSERIPDWQGGAPQNAAARTQAVMALLRAVPNVNTWMTSLPSNQVWTPKPPDVPMGTPPIPLLLDGWGNPMLYVPGGGLTGVVVSGGVGSDSVRVITVTAPDQRGFWASAGPDGFFTDPDPNPMSKPDGDRKAYGDDNVYSFQ